MAARRLEFKTGGREAAFNRNIQAIGSRRGYLQRARSRDPSRRGHRDRLFDLRSLAAYKADVLTAFGRFFLAQVTGFFVLFPVPLDVLVASFFVPGDVAGGIVAGRGSWKSMPTTKRPSTSAPWA